MTTRLFRRRGDWGNPASSIRAATARILPRLAPACEVCNPALPRPIICRFGSSTGIDRGGVGTTATEIISPSAAGKCAHDFRRKIDGETIRRQGMATVLSHSGLPPPGSGDGNGPLCPPIELSATYERPPDGEYGPKGRVYARTHNPTREALEETLAQAEILRPRRQYDSGGDGSTGKAGEECNAVPEEPSAVCAAFSSGMAAVSAVILAHSAPLYVVLPDNVYHGVPTVLRSVFDRHGVTWCSIDMSDLGQVRDALVRSSSKGLGKNNVILWVETPSNPLCKVVNIRALCDLAKELRDGDANLCITTLVDSTWAPPPITQPLLLGADASLHSGTKYLGGHSDVLLGAVTCSSLTPWGQALALKIREVQITMGAVASPFDSWLTMRGMRTLNLRLERQSKTALELAIFLEDHPLVKSVHYPGLPSHPDYDVASVQMGRGVHYGGMLSFEVADSTVATAVAGGVQTVRRATSLGGTETLIEHRASIEPAGHITSPPGLLRLSVGLEDVDDLKEDLDVALRIAEKVIWDATIEAE